jgi:hypothetical protein
MTQSAASTLAIHFGVPLLQQFAEKGFFGKPFVRVGPMFTSVCPILFQTGALLGYGLRGYPGILGCLFVARRANAASYVLESWKKEASDFLARIQGTPSNLHELYVVPTLITIGVDLNDPKFMTGSRSKWIKEKIKLEGVNEITLFELMKGVAVGYHHSELFRSCWEGTYRQRPEGEWEEAYRFGVVSTPDRPEPTVFAV